MLFCRCCVLHIFDSVMVYMFDFIQMVVTLSKVNTSYKETEYKKTQDKILEIQIVLGENVMILLCVFASDFVQHGCAVCVIPIYHNIYYFTIVL